MKTPPRGPKLSLSIAERLNEGERNFLTLYGLRITGGHHITNPNIIEVEAASGNTFWLNRELDFGSWIAKVKEEATRFARIRLPDPNLAEWIETIKERDGL